MTPDQNPPQRNDMSAIEKLIAHAASRISTLVLDPNGGDESAPSFNSIIRDAIDQSTAAMREELERSLAAMAANLQNCQRQNDQLRTQLAQLKQELALERASKVQAIHESTSKLQ